MLQEKAMVNDALASVRSSLTAYTTAISECSNPNLRSALQQIRNGDENSQYELYKIAQSKGYYQPAHMADDSEVRQVKSELQGGQPGQQTYQQMGQEGSPHMFNQR
ncbi:MAG: spore coat protein [Burkholderiales bacterium]